MFRPASIVLALALVLSTVPALAADGFWLDGQGRVFTIDSYGRIAIDGGSTSWSPDRQNLDLHVAETGDAFYTDSYGRLCRNGSELGYSWIRPHYFKVDGDGDVYTVKDWVTQSIQRNGGDTGYEIQNGSGFVVDREGRLYYTSAKNGNLWISGSDTGHALDRDDFVVSPGGDLYFANHLPPNRHQLFRYRPGAENSQHVAFLASYRGFAIDRRGNLYVAEQGWRITKNGQDTGWRGPAVHLDGAGNCYFQDQNGRICRNGQPTGYTAQGVMEVAANGDIVYVPDISSGELYKNGRALGIRITQ
ncbi:MAG: hypothetical protein HY303_09310 [Candidatus Wallbacteria bacterium]|nr:hypothetical protein [Candidatus Wallbacteria bacterium]